MSGSEDSKIYLWDLQTREIMQVLDGHQGFCFSFSLKKFLRFNRDPFFVDVVVAVAVSVTHISCFIYSDLFIFVLQTHPQQNMIASGSMESDLTVKVWVDRGST